MRNLGRFLAGVVVLGLIAPAIAADRTADEILKEIDAIKPPRTLAEYQANAPKQAELAAELYKVAPEHPKTAKLMGGRWTSLNQLGKAEEAQKEIDAVLAAGSKAPEAVQIEAAFTNVILTARKNAPNLAAAIPAAEEFMKRAPKDDRGPSILQELASSLKDEAKKTEIEDRIVKDYPEGRATKSILAMRKKKEAIGKPFELEFTEATKGTTIAMKDLKGKVVVIDFWATWCGPCIAEMPNMKKLYAEYKDKGVEFIGVSLDQPKEKGGLDKLKEYVAKNDIQWPQYYQGNFWQSEFSSGWGINSIPCVFMVDQKGNLYSIEARGKLETMIPELLKKNVKDAGAGGQ